MKTKNKFIIIALVCLITISSVWAGRTYAYFTASSNASGTITMGTLKVNDFGELNAETNLKVVPNQTVTKNFKATIESDIKYYKRLSLSAEVKAETGKTHETTCGDYVDDDTKILNATVANFEKYTTDDGAIYYYDLTPVTPTSATTEEEFTISISVHDWVGDGGCDYYMGATINMGVKIEVIQADYLESNTTGATYTSTTALHNVWANILSPVQDVSEYPNWSFRILSEDDKTMAVSAADTSITEANIPAYVSKDNKKYTVTCIDNCAFQYCSLTSIVIPDSVQVINAWAFTYADVTVYLSRSIKYISPNAFQDVCGKVYYEGTVAEMATICPGESGGRSSETIICLDGNYVYKYYWLITPV